jgi:t-SNARE complex subunit (syntaxin)
MKSRKTVKSTELSGGRESKIICYLAAVILAILVLIAVIVVLTMMVANKEMGKEIDF